MKRQIPGLSQATQSNCDVPDGEYLVRVTRAQYRWDKTKPYYILRFEILEPATSARLTFNGRIYCSVKALWKLNWFLRDFGYDPELLGRDELDERALCGLTGVVKVSHKTFDGHPILSLDAFATAERWTEMFGTSSPDQEAA
jgi:hypothetical protein